MKKKVIQKNLSDAEMFVGHKEELTFETAFADEAAPAPKVVKPSAKQEKLNFRSEFFTPELQEEVGKELLAIKLELFKEGIVDYKIKVTREGRKVILTAKA